MMLRLTLFCFISMYFVCEVSSQMWGPDPGMGWWGPRRPWWRRYNMGRHSWSDDSPWPRRHWGDGNQWNNNNQWGQDSQNQWNNNNGQNSDKLGQGFQDPQRDQWTQKNRDGPAPPTTTTTQASVEVPGPPGI